MTPIRSIARPVSVAVLCAAAAVLTPHAAAAPATYWTGARAISQLQFTQIQSGQPPATLQDNRSQTLYPLAADDPARGSDLAVGVHTALPQAGLTGDATAEAQMGVLKSWSQVSYGGRQGIDAFHFASSSGWASFGDTLVVTADGLAAGTPVTFTVDIDIHALFQQPGPIPGRGQIALADLVVSAEDVDTGVQRSFSWNPGIAATGLAGGRFRWDYQTAVGRSFVLGAFLNTQASHESPLASTPSADLGHTIHIALDNADARLNTVGLSGHDFRLGGGGTDPDPTPVPAPASVALVLLGLAALSRRRVTSPGTAARG